MRYREALTIVLSIVSRVGPLSTAVCDHAFIFLEGDAPEFGFKMINFHKFMFLGELLLCDSSHRRTLRS